MFYHLLSSMYFSRWLRTDVLGCVGTLKVATLRHVRTLDHANPRKSVAREPCGNAESCNFTSRSRARPRQSTQRVARHAEMLQKDATLPRIRAFDHATQRVGGAPKSCNFTSRSRTRPRQSTQRAAFPIDGIGAGSGFRKKDRYRDVDSM